MPDLKLSNCSSLENLHHLLVKDHPNFKVEIGLFGGRNYSIIQGTETTLFHLNDLVKRLKSLPKNPQNQKDSLYVYNISKIVTQLDLQGAELLSKKNLFLRILTAIKKWLGNRGFSREKELEVMRKDFSVPKFYTNKNSQHALNESQKVIIDFLSQTPCRAGVYDILCEVANKKVIDEKTFFEQFQEYVFKKWNHPHFKNEKEMKSYLVKNPSEKDKLNKDFESVMNDNIFTLQDDSTISEQTFIDAVGKISAKDLSIALDEVIKKDEKTHIASYLTYLAFMDEEDFLSKFLKEDYVWPNEQAKDLVRFYTNKDNLLILKNSLILMLKK